MESGSVYNSTTIPSEPSRKREYLDNISYASLNPNRCCNVALVVVGILSVLVGVSLILYGCLFYISVRDPAPFETAMARDRRHDQMLMYQVVMYAGVPIAVLGLLLWTVYLHRTGRCGCCPGVRHRRRDRLQREAQRLAEADNISNGYSAHPVTTLPLEEQARLVKDDPLHTGLEDTDAMLFRPAARPVLVPMQTTI